VLVRLTSRPSPFLRHRRHVQPGHHPRHPPALLLHLAHHLRGIDVLLSPALGDGLLDTPAVQPDLKAGQRVAVRTTSKIRDTCPPQMDADSAVIQTEK
jgi:hypothetical protein